jgi:hypothetical protein
MVGLKDIMLDRQVVAMGRTFREKTLIDAETGLMKAMTIYRPDGKLSDVTTVRYEKVNDYLVLSYRARQLYGLHGNGSWEVIEKTIERRSNISVENQ